MRTVSDSSAAVHRRKRARYRFDAFSRREIAACGNSALYDGGVGARVIRKPDSSARKKKESLTLWTIVFAVGFPMLLAYVLVAVDMRSDLSELKPSAQVDDAGFVPVGWPELEGFGAQGPVSQRPVRMIGYMMDGYRPEPDGASVDMFILLPEAGQFLHPAHRIPNQMVEVHLIHPMAFKNRQLVWVSGRLNRTVGKPDRERAAWAIGDAEVNPAQPQEITKWFQP
jgi:hypothetical protein